MADGHSEDSNSTTATKVGQKRQYIYNSYEWYEKTADNRWKCKHCDATFTYQCSSQIKRRHSEKYHPDLIEATSDGELPKPVHPNNQGTAVGRARNIAANEASLEYFKNTGKLSEAGAQIFQCIFCDKEMTRKYYRFREHLANQCTKISAETKADFMEKNKDRFGKQCRSAALTRPKRQRYMDECSGSEYDSDSGDDKARAVNILTKLLSNSSGESKSKKPLSEFTDDDFERESKELKIKIDRLKCKELEEKARFYTKFSTGFSIIVEACHSYVDEKKRAGGVGMSAPNSIDPTSILQAAYEESISGEIH